MYKQGIAMHIPTIIDIHHFHGKNRGMGRGNG
jgi:hypothetical protein